MEYRKMLNVIMENIPDVQAALIINNQGDLVECIESDSFEAKVDIHELKYIAELVSLRFHIVDFDKLLDGFEMTINIFRNSFMLVTSIFHDILIVIVPKKISMTEAVDKISIVKPL